MSLQAAGAVSRLSFVRRASARRVFKPIVHVLAATALLAGAGQAAAQSYELVFLNPGLTITGNIATNRALDINNLGQIVGMAQPFPSASVTGAQWMSTGGNPTFYSGAVTTAINDSGQFTGQNGAVATRWNANGSSTSLGTLGGSTSFGSDINNAGMVAGYSTTVSGATHAFAWNNGTMQDLGTLGGSSSHGQAINAAGAVAGFSTTASGATHAAVWSNGGVTDLGALGGYLASQAGAINNLGQVVGFSDTKSDFSGIDHATLWSNGSAIDLGTLAGATYSYAQDINNAGEIVGQSDGRAVLWQNGGAAVDLNSFLSASEQAKVRLTTAYGVNDQGWIVGQAQGIDASCGFLCSAAFVMIPVPEPGTWALLLAGIGMVGFIARRRRT